MSSFNRTILMGNLTRDPEVRQSQTGTFIVKFGLAINDRVPDGQGGWKDEVSYFDCVVFGNRAEAFSRFMGKGRPVLIEGRLKQNRWKDKETGANRAKVEIMVENWEFAGGQTDGHQGGQYQQQGAQQQQQGGAPAPGFPGDQNGFPDDVPF